MCDLISYCFCLYQWQTESHIHSGRSTCLISASIWFVGFTFIIHVNRIKLPVYGSYLCGYVFRQERWTGEMIILLQCMISCYLLIFNYSISPTIMASTDCSHKVKSAVKQEQMTALRAHTAYAKTTLRELCCKWIWVLYLHKYSVVFDSQGEKQWGQRYAFSLTLHYRGLISKKITSAAWI